MNDKESKFRRRFWIIYAITTMITYLYITYKFF